MADEAALLDAVDVDAIDIESQETIDEQQQDQGDDGGESAADGEDTTKIDGRRFNPEWSKALKELRELHPERADMLTKLRDNYARYLALQEVAPKGLDDVRGWKSTIEALGGPESAAAMMERQAQSDAADERIAAGDFSVMSELAPEIKSGIYQMLPDMLSDLAATDEKAFTAAVAPHFQAALAATGMGEALKAIYAKLGDNDEAKAGIKQIFDWYQKQTSGAGEMQRGAAGMTPREKALQEKLAKYESTAEDSFVSTVTDSIQKHFDDGFSKDADVYIKQRNLTQEQQDDLRASLNAKMAEKLAADGPFQAQLKAFKAQRNRSPEAVTNFIKAKVDEIRKPLLDQLVLTRYGKATKATPVVKANGDANRGAVRVAQAPPVTEWDRDKMEAAGYENTVKKGIFYLQGGRTVQLQKGAQ